MGTLTPGTPLKSTYQTLLDRYGLDDHELRFLRELAQDDTAEGRLADRLRTTLRTLEHLERRLVQTTDEVGAKIVGIQIGIAHASHVGLGLQSAASAMAEAQEVHAQFDRAANDVVTLTYLLGIPVKQD